MIFLRRSTGHYFRTMALFREDCASSMSNDLGGMRKPYKGKNDEFRVDDLVAKEPIAQFKSWFDDACNTPGIIEANAMCLATATKSGQPSARYVLLKGYGKEGFRFFTNYTSRKGKELAENPFVSLVFYWEPLMRSVRIEGHVERLSEAESDDYFHSRPRGSQIGACISSQSQVIPGRHVLTDREEQLQEEYKDETKVIPKPKLWGGFLVVPSVIEFWQGQSTRIHDRIVFRRPDNGEQIDPTLTHQGEDGWVFERLSP